MTEENTPYLLSPSAKIKALSRLSAFLQGGEFERRFSIEERAFLTDALSTLASKQHHGIVFRHLRTENQRDHFEIGHEGGPLRVVKTCNRGVWATWWLLDDGGASEALRATDLAAPDATEPEQSVRRMIRVTAASQFARWGMPELEAAAKACRVANGTGVVRCERPAHAPRVITR